MPTAEQQQSVLVTVDQRCRSCIVPRIIVRALRDWHEEEHGPATLDGLEEFVERRCGDCLDSVQAEETATGYQLFIAARD
ncbi:hypothetical protein [Rhizobium cremeum]|uniref:hypothetical protein n=1 Tax=Rhizobium cremeum TaxID=2813827 RepID=UPI0039E04311